MTYLGAAIEHTARTLATSLTRALTEKCRGFSDSEAGDYLAADRLTYRGPSVRCEGCGNSFTPGLLQPCYACRLAKREAEEEVAEPPVGTFIFGRNETFPLPNLCGGFGGIKVGDQHCLRCGANITAVSFHACTKTPVAGQRGENPAGVTPPTPAGSPLCHARKPNDPPNIATFCDELAGHDGDHRHGRSEFWPKYGSCPECCAPYVIGKPCTTCLLGCLKADDEAAEPILSRPPGYYTSMERGFAAGRYDFPTCPTMDQEHVASDGGEWIYRECRKPSTDGYWEAMGYPPTGDPYLAVKAAERVANIEPCDCGAQLLEHARDEECIDPPTPTDPSPTSSPARQPSVGDEGSPLDSAIPPAPRGERPDWPTWAVPAICDVLATHQPSESTCGIECLEFGYAHDTFADWQEWREHVAPLIAERVDASLKFVETYRKK